MRPCLILIAILGAAVPAVAQSAGATDEPTTVSGLVIAVTKPTQVRALTVMPTCSLPPNREAVDSLFDSPPPEGIRRTLPSSGAKAVLEKDVALIKKQNVQDYGGMALNYAVAARKYIPAINQQIKCLGDLLDIKFLHVTERNFDDYELDFKYGVIEWAIEPRSANSDLHRLYAPQPVTREFEGLLNSVQRGEPDYANLNPALAADMRGKWPSLQRKIQRWGGLNPEWGVLKSLFFVRQENDGSYDYMVSFGRHRLGWKVATVAGKIDALTYVDADADDDADDAAAAPGPPPAPSGQPDVPAHVDAVAARPAPAQASAASGKPTDLSGLTVVVPKPTQLSGVEVAVRRATEVSGITVAPSCRMPPDTSWGDTLFDAPKITRYSRLEQSEGTQQWLLTDLLLLENQNTHNYAKMGSALEETARRQFPVLRQRIRCLGELKSIKFLHVSEDGLDDFEVSFSKGALEWALSPLQGGGILDGPTVIRNYFPQPTTRKFNDLLRSIQQGKLNIENLTPELGASLRNQWPSLQAKFIEWGKLRSRWLESNASFFVREEANGSYTYVVSFGRRKVGWNVQVSADTGKIAALTYADPTD